MAIRRYHCSRVGFIVLQPSTALATSLLCPGGGWFKSDTNAMFWLPFVGKRAAVVFASHDWAE
jgi:hypothetical protein